MFIGLTAPEIISRIITLLIAFTIHELSHAVTAVQLGDDTPRRMGRVTLNPLAHLDPIGSLLLIFAGFGWAKPVQHDPDNLRTDPHVGMAIVACGRPHLQFCDGAHRRHPLSPGPGQPLRLARRADYPQPACYVLFDFIQLNLILMLFNLIPIAPLDGSKVLAGFAPREWDSLGHTGAVGAVPAAGPGVPGPGSAGPAAGPAHHLSCCGPLLGV